MARRKFTREFRMSAVQLVNQQGYTGNEKGSEAKSQEFPVSCAPPGAAT